jgi:hypothetical protein
LLTPPSLNLSPLNLMLFCKGVRIGSFSEDDDPQPAAPPAVPSASEARRSLQLQLQSNQRTKILSAFEAQKVDSDNEQPTTSLAVLASTAPVSDSLEQALPQALQLSAGSKGSVDRVAGDVGGGNRSPLIGSDGSQRRSAARRLKKKPTELLRSATAPLDLDVGGVRYRTSLTTLQSVPESMLGAMFSGRFELARQLDGSIFIGKRVARCARRFIVALQIATDDCLDTCSTGCATDRSYH